MKVKVITFLSVFFISIGLAREAPGLHLSGNFSLSTLGHLLSLALGYSGGDDLSLRLKGSYTSVSGASILNLKGGIRKYIGTTKPSGPFVEGGFGYWSVSGRSENLTINIGAFSLYGNLGYRFGQRFFVEGSVGVESFFIIFALPVAEIAVGVSF